MSATTRLSVADYERLIEEGYFETRREERIELIRGELRPMSPIGNEHNQVVYHLSDWWATIPKEKRPLQSPQCSVLLPAEGSMPQPDYAWLVRRNYDKSRPTPADILLLMEVSDSSLAYDRGEKATLYAEAGIKDYWIVNLIDRCVEVHRDPKDGAYQTIHVHHIGEEVRPLALSEAVLPVARLFETDFRLSRHS